MQNRAPKKQAAIRATLRLQGDCPITIITVHVGSGVNSQGKTKWGTRIPTKTIVKWGFNF